MIDLENALAGARRARARAARPSTRRATTAAPGTGGGSRA